MSLLTYEDDISPDVSHNKWWAASCHRQHDSAL